MIKVWDYKKEYELLRDDILNAVDGVFKRECVWSKLMNLKINFHLIMIHNTALGLVIVQMQ